LQKINMADYLFSRAASRLRPLMTQSGDTTAHKQTVKATETFSLVSAVLDNPMYLLAGRRFKRHIYTTPSNILLRIHL
jgi:hypothetical protein